MIKKILIIDDDEFILFGISRAISGHPHANSCQVLTAQHGKQAVDLIEQSSIDLVVTDLKMPIMNGYAVVDHINKFFPGVPVYVMTGDYLPDVVPRFKSAQVAGFISKPFSFRQLADDIFETLEKNEPEVVHPAVG